MHINKKFVVTILFWFAVFQMYILHSTWTRSHVKWENADGNTQIDKKVSLVSYYHAFSNDTLKLGKEYNDNLTLEGKPCCQNSKNTQNTLGIDFYGVNRSKIQKILIEYEPFQLPEPKFLAESDRKMFYLGKENKQFGKIHNSSVLLRGEIYNVREGTFQMPFDCGYRSDYTYTLKKRDVPSNRWYFALAPMLIPEGNTFQHFIDGTLPKIVQIIEYLRKPFMKMLYRKPRDKIIHEILDKLKIPKENIVYGDGVVGADNLLFTCNTPPLHPVLWSKARRLIGAYEKRPTSWNDSQVILVTRVGSYNGGRNILNMEKTVNTLKAKYGEKSVSIFNGPYTLDQSIEFFSKAKILIGVHGGGLYNMLFCPRDTVVVEITPTYEDGRMVAAADKIFWAQSYLLGHEYWRLLLLPKDKRGNLNIDVEKLRQVLDKIELEHSNR